MDPDGIIHIEAAFLAAPMRSKAFPRHKGDNCVAIVMAELNRSHGNVNVLPVPALQDLELMPLDVDIQVVDFGETQPGRDGAHIGAAHPGHGRTLPEHGGVGVLVGL